MNSRITLGVYRRLDNRLEGLGDDSPRALELHNRRRDALHSALGGDPGIGVMDWGDTDDARPHEYVEIVLSTAATAVFQYARVPGLKWLGQKLAEKATDTVLGETAKAIVAGLRPRQEANQILNFILKLPDGTHIVVDPPDRNATITINFGDGTLQSLQYMKAVARGDDQ
ncbi:MAG TPA: hypothetical protein VI932_00245 [Bacteroidota bacterium]|nr:hypothetical protein [Bacteroidota bacterium]